MSQNRAQMRAAARRRRGLEPVDEVEADETPEVAGDDDAVKPVTALAPATPDAANPAPNLERSGEPEAGSSEQATETKGPEPEPAGGEQPKDEKKDDGEKLDVSKLRTHADLDAAAEKLGLEVEGTVAEKQAAISKALEA